MPRYVRTRHHGARDHDRTGGRGTGIRGRVQILAYGVARQTDGIGLRMALGAERWQMLWMVLRQSLVLGLVGTAAGIGASLALGQFARNLLFQVRENDAVALATAAVMMLLVAVCAGFFPALRAARVEPLTALRLE